jgi:hypothetical protein
MTLEDKKTLRPADVDRLVAPAAIDRGDRYRVLWECLAKKNKRSDEAPGWRAFLTVKPGTSGRFLQNSWFDTPWLV